MPARALFITISVLEGARLALTRRKFSLILLAILLFNHSWFCAYSEEEWHGFEDFDLFLKDDNSWEIAMWYKNEPYVFVPALWEGRPISSIGPASFSECDEIRCIVLPASIRHIKESAFYLCSGLEYIVMNNGLVDIGDFAFSSCYSLKAVYMPSTLERVGEYAFIQCNSLVIAVFPEELISIGNGCFTNCSALQYVVLPDSVQSIGLDLYAGCGSIVNIYPFH